MDDTIGNLSSQEDMMNSTLKQLSESILQQAAIAINSITVPHFNGLPNEDVHEFLKQFKFQTATLSEQHRCQALNKSLQGAAMTWAKANIKEALRTSDWKTIKNMMIDRFGPADRRLRYKEKLSQLQFDDKKSTLTAYVENYLSLYKMAHETHSEPDAIQALRWNLPDKVIRGLNLIDDSWANYRTSDRLYSLVKRYEQNVLPFEKTSGSPSISLDAETVKSMILEFKETISKQLKKTKDEITNDNQRLAIMNHQQLLIPPNEESDTHERPTYQNRNYVTNRYGRNSNFNNPYDGYNNSDYSEDEEFECEPRNFFNSIGSDPQHKQLKVYDPASAYFTRFGKPLNHCRYCQGAHFNRHCPMIASDLE